MAGDRPADAIVRWLRNGIRIGCFVMYVSVEVQNKVIGLNCKSYAYIYKMDAQ